MNLLLSAVMFSPNIGDGVIAECFCAAAPNSTHITRLDLAGRTDYAAQNNGLRQRILPILAALPAPVANKISGQLVKAQIRRRLAPLLPEKLADIDGILIGGGQLLADANMNFPLKIQYLVAAAETRGIPFGIHSVGVAATWSGPAQALFGKVLSSPNLRFLSVRDAASQANLTAHMAAMNVTKMPPLQVFPDPGFLAAPLLLPDRPQTRAHPPRRIGLGITHPTALALHGGGAGPQNWPQWYADTARALIRQGLHVTLFTNGAFEDETCLSQTADLLQDISTHQLQRASRSQRPTDLVRLIATFDGTISHRLHASILAYSCGIAPIGLPWDRKLEGFFNLINRPENLMKTDQPSPDALIQHLTSAPLDAAHHADLLGGARAGVTAAVSAFAKTA